MKRRPRFSDLALRLALTPIVGVVPGAALLAFGYEIDWRGGIGFGCLAVATLPAIVMWAGVRSMVVRPLRVIVRGIDALTEGDYTSRTGIIGPGELSAAARALDDLAGKLEAGMEAARASERRYRRLFEHNPAGMFRTRARDGRVLEANEAAVKILGYASVTDAKTHRAETFYADPDDRPRLLEHLRATHTVSGLEIDFRRKDGTVVPVLLSVCRVDEDGETYLDGQFIAAEHAVTAGR